MSCQEHAKLGKPKMTKKRVEMRTRSAAPARPQKVPVLFDSLFKRINFALAKQGRKLRVTRGQARAALGQFYVTSDTGVEATHVNIEAFARQIGVMRGWESLVLK